MRLLHTADWHLGRTLGGHSLRAEQEHLLGEAIPPPCRRCGARCGPDRRRHLRPRRTAGRGGGTAGRHPAPHRPRPTAPGVMIPGNHDEARRLSFGARMSRLPAGCISAIRRSAGRGHRCGRHGPVAIVAAGYATPLGLAQRAGAEGFADHDAGFGLAGAATARAVRRHAPARAGRACLRRRRRRSATASAGISVGGTGQINAARFAGFHYVALGHLHRPQALAGRAAALQRLAAGLFLQRGGARPSSAAGRDRRRRRR